MPQFESFRASQLYCKKCGQSMTVRERLLLVLPTKEINEYLCSGCGESLGTREVSQYDKLLEVQQAEMARRRQLRKGRLNS